MNNLNQQFELKEKMNLSMNSSSDIKNHKKRSRESFEIDTTPINHNSSKRTKFVNHDDYKENILMNQIESKQSYKNYTSDIYNHISKNDVSNVIWKLVIPKNELMNFVSQRKNFTEKLFSRRKDYWYFYLELTHHGFNFKLKCENEKMTDNNNSNNESYIEKVFNSIFYEVEVNFNILNFKNQNFSFKKVKNNSEEFIKEIPIQSEFFNMNYTQPISSTRSSIKEKSPEEKDNIIIIAEISIIKNFEYQIHQSEGYTGIVNEAATCYMNSMLQTLNIFGEFKRAVFQIPTEDEDYNSVALSLQRLFYDLMKDKSPVSTNRLVKSFGWGREQILIQHDVQEFNLLLSDVMEKKMKGTPGEGTFSKLFEGKLINYIQCVNVNYKSEKEEKFNDLQLTVKGCKDIYESLNHYTEEEILDNDDKYYAEGHGKQKAKKGIRFSKFPNVLIMQLKRFEYNPKREAMVKINDYFQFYDEIDLKEYMNQNLQNNDSSTYTLHSVVVHQGNANSGHYFAFIRPSLEDLWMQFNDELVRPADKYEVFDNNFGGNFTTYKHKTKGEINSTTNYFESNAYILVYIKNSERTRILQPVQSINIPEYLTNRFEMEKNEEKKIQMKKLRQVENMNIVLLTKESLFADNNKNKLGIVNSLADLNYDMPLIYNKKQRMLINFPKFSTISDLLKFIQTETNIHQNLMKLYQYENGDVTLEGFLPNRSNYVMNLIDEKNYCKTLYDLTNCLKNRIITFFLYVEDNKLKIFKEDKFNFKEEWRLELDLEEIEKEKIVFISKELNNFTFYKNDELDIPKKEINPFKSLNDNYMEKLIFVKEFDPVSKSFRITKTKLINLNILNKFSKLEELLNDSDNHMNDINYLIEKSSLNDKSEYNKQNLFLSENNYKNILSDLSSIILYKIIKNEQNSILEKIEELYETIYVDVYSSENSDYVINKMKINYLKIQDENQIKCIILENIIDQGLFKKVIDLQEHYYIDQNKNLVRLEEEFLKKSITVDYIELHSEKDKGPKFALAIKELPFLKYFNVNECRLEFDLHLFSKQISSETSFINVGLFDINNTRICKLSIIYPKKVRKCKDLIEFIYDLVLSNTKFVKEIYDREDYFFILQNPKKSYIFNILKENNSEISRFESKADNIEFRLQPFSPDDIEAFDNANYYKIFVSFQSIGIKSNENHPFRIEPIIIYLDKNSKIYELKIMIIEKIRKMGFNQLLENGNFLKFYMSKVYDNKIHKDTNLQNYKEEDTLENIFKDLRIYNILVEIIKNISK